MAALEVPKQSSFTCLSCTPFVECYVTGDSHIKLISLQCLQVYVRRAYIAYELNSVQHRQLRDNTCIVEFQFMLPTSHPNRYRVQETLAILICFASPSLLVGTMDTDQYKGGLFPSTVASPLASHATRVIQSSRCL